MAETMDEMEERLERRSKRARGPLVDDVDDDTESLDIALSRDVVPPPPPPAPMPPARKKRRRAELSAKDAIDALRG